MSTDTIRAAFRQRTVYGSLDRYLALAADHGVIDQAERNALLEEFDAHRDCFTPAAVEQVEWFRKSTQNLRALPIMQNGGSVQSAIRDSLYAGDSATLEVALANYKAAVRAGYEPKGIDEGLLLDVVGVKGGARVLKMLLEAGLPANPTRGLSVGGNRTALHLALLQLNATGRSRGMPPPDDDERREIVQLLVKAGADVNAQDLAGLPGPTPLHLLATSDSGVSLDLAKYLIKQGADPSRRAETFLSDDVFRINSGEPGDTPLAVARRLGNTKMAHLLERAGGAVANSEAEAKLAQLSNPQDVHSALQAGGLDAARVWSLAMYHQFGNGAALLEGGLDPKVRVYGAYTKEGPKPLFHAFVDFAHAASLPEGLFAAAVKAGALTEERDSQGRTALLSAFERPFRYPEESWRPVLVELARSGANVNAQDLQGNTALHHAAARGAWGGVVAALVEAGANVSLPNQAGETPLVAAAKSGKTDSVDLLLRAGADLNQTVGPAQLPVWLLVAQAVPQNSMTALDQPSQAILDRISAAAPRVDLKVPGVRDALEKLAQKPHLAMFARRLLEAGGAKAPAPAPIGQVVLERAGHVFSYDGVKLYRDNVDISPRNLEGMVPFAAGDKILLFGKSPAAIAYREAQPLAGCSGLSSVYVRGTQIFHADTGAWTRAGFVNAAEFSGLRVDSNAVVGRTTDGPLTDWAVVGTTSDGKPITFGVSALTRKDLAPSSFDYGPRVDLAQPVPFAGEGRSQPRSMGGVEGTIVPSAAALVTAASVIRDGRGGSYLIAKEAGGYGVKLDPAVARQLGPGSPLAMALVLAALEPNPLLDMEQPTITYPASGVNTLDPEQVKGELRWNAEASGVSRALELAGQEDDGTRNATGVRMRDAVDLAARWVSNDEKLRMLKVERHSFYAGDYHGFLGIDDATGEVRVFAIKSGGL